MATRTRKKRTAPVKLAVGRLLRVTRGIVDALTETPEEADKRKHSNLGGLCGECGKCMDAASLNNHFKIAHPDTWNEWTSEPGPARATNSDKKAAGGQDATNPRPRPTARQANDVGRKPPKTEWERRMSDEGSNTSATGASAAAASLEDAGKQFAISEPEDFIMMRSEMAAMDEGMREFADGVRRRSERLLEMGMNPGVVDHLDDMAKLISNAANGFTDFLAAVQKEYREYLEMRPELKELLKGGDG